MDVCYAVAVWLERMGFGTLNTDIFIDQIEDGINGIWVERNAGSNNNYVPISETVVDIYFKNTQASVCIDRAMDVKNAIHRMYDTTANNILVYSFLVIGDVEAVQRDLEYAIIYKLSVQVLHRDLTLIS